MRVFRSGSSSEVKTLKVRKGSSWVVPSEVKVRRNGSWFKVWPIRTLAIASPVAGPLAPGDVGTPRLIPWRFSTLDNIEAVNKREDSSGRTVPNSALRIPTTGYYRITYQAEVRRPNINQLVFVRSRLMSRVDGRETNLWPGGSTNTWSEVSTRDEYQVTNPCVLNRVRLTAGTEIYPYVQGFWASGGSQALTNRGHFTVELLAD